MGEIPAAKRFVPFGLLIFWTAICQILPVNQFHDVLLIFWTRGNSIRGSIGKCERIMLSWIADFVHSIFVRIPNGPMISSDP